MLPRFCEYEVKKLHSPTCSRQETEFSHLIFTEPGKRTLAHHCTGFSSEIGTKLRDWAVGQAGGSC